MPSPPTPHPQVVALQRELDAKEAELRDAHEAARNLSAAVTSVTGEGEGGRGADGRYRDPTSGEVVPDWRLREFEELKSAVASLWEQLDVPPEEVREEGARAGEDGGRDAGG